MKSYQLYVDGAFIDAHGTRTIDVINPATQDVIARVPEADAVDVSVAVAAARRAFDAGPWAESTAQERGRILFRLAEIVRARAAELAELETINNGKPIVEAEFDIADVATCFEYYGGLATKIHGDVVPVPDNALSLALREPIGVCGQIIPWNYPLLMAAWKIAPALCAGCTVVLKPAEQTPLTILELAKHFAAAGLPPGVVNIVTGAAETGAALTAHPAVDKIAFTGSTEVGKLIVKAATGNLKKVTLELGGKSPVIVLPDADLDAAGAGAAAGIFYNQGQVCTAGSRLYVHKSAFDKVVGAVADRANAIKVGPGLDESNDMGPLVSEEQLNRVMGFFDSGKQEGAKAVAGGERLGDKGYFVKPTVYTGTNRDMRLIREEIFGPVIAAEPFDDDDLDRIAAIANDSDFGLAASVWSRDISKALKMASKIKAGTVWVNSHNVYDAALPFGGFKQSGWGREMGEYAIQNYTEVKAVTVKL